MTQQELQSAFKDECRKLAELVAAKNSNYSGVNGNGAFHNFEIIENLSGGHVTREAGVVVRITDKLARLWALLDGNPDAVSESFGDTCVDLAGYALLLKLMHEEKQQKEHYTVTQYTDSMSIKPDNGGVEVAGLSDAVAPGSYWERLAGKFR